MPHTAASNHTEIVLVALAAPVLRAGEHRRPANAGETAQSARVLPGWNCGCRCSRTPGPIATVQVPLESSRLSHSLTWGLPSNNLVVVLLLYCKSTISSMHRWRCCLRCNDASNILTVVLVLYCESPSSGQREWPCCLRCHDTSNSLTVVLLLCCESPSGSQHQWPCGWTRPDASINLTVVSLFYSNGTISGQCK